MDNTRNLKDNEVPAAAIESVENMANKIVNELVDDFVKELNMKRKTISPEGIDLLKGVVSNRVSITLKITAKVNIDLVNDMKIPVVDMDQVELKEFGGAQ